MLRLSTKARYALRAMIELALREGEGAVQLREIADAQRLSPKYLEQLAIPLRHAGLVHSERGPSGGYSLARPAGEITALEIVRAVEGPLDLLDCVGRAAICERSSSCAARELWQELSVAVGDVLGKRTLADLAECQRTLNSSAGRRRMRAV
jgi:Rrf2 family transcriptional regulator, cysteine metabolism repressor